MDALKQRCEVLYADEASAVFKSPIGPTKMTVLVAPGLAVSETKTEPMMLRTPHQET